MISSTWLARVLATTLAVMSVLATAWEIVFARTIAVGNGCGYDGAVYCQMFFGERGIEPYGRRILAPRLAHLLSSDPLVGFRILDGLVIAGIVVVAVALVRLTTRPRTGAAMVDRIVPVLIIISVVLISRNLLRFVLSYPVITDPLALLLLLIAAYGILRLGHSRWFVVLAAAASALAPLAREVFGIAIVGGVVAAVMVRQASWPRAATVAGAAVVGTVVAFDQVPSSSAGGVASVVWGWVISDFGSLSGLVRFGTMLMIGLGFFWVPFLWKRFWRRIEPTEIILLSLAAILFVASVFGGGDTDRIVMPVGILLALVIARAASVDSTMALGLTFLAGAYFVAQYPFTVVGASADSWIAFFSLRDTPLVELQNEGIAPVLLALPLAVLGVMITTRVVATGGAHRRPDEPAEPDAAPVTIVAQRRRRLPETAARPARSGLVD